MDDLAEKNQRRAERSCTVAASHALGFVFGAGAKRSAGVSSGKRSGYTGRGKAIDPPSRAGTGAGCPNLRPGRRERLQRAIQVAQLSNLGNLLAQSGLMGAAKGGGRPCITRYVPGADGTYQCHSIEEPMPRETACDTPPAPEPISEEPCPAAACQQPRRQQQQTLSAWTGGSAAAGGNCSLVAGRRRGRDVPLLLTAAAFVFLR